MSQQKLSQFNRIFFDPQNRITFIGTGASGGKAKSLIFINDILLSDEFDTGDFPQADIKIPTFTVIRTDVFDLFMKRNNLYEVAMTDIPDDRMAHAFQNADLPFEILGDLRGLITEVHFPLAVRSSSMFEDAMYEPFAGVYSTKMIPNNQPDIDTRFLRLVEAIKFVYASTFFRSAKNYILSTKHRLEDEKMAVIIQEVVGSKHSDRFYPELSGVARSYNFYPMGKAKPEEGVVNLALGLGKTIVDGGVTWAYSPEFPKVNPPYGSVGEMLKQSQIEFWVVNMGKPPAYNPTSETEYLEKENLTVADFDGTLRHLASTVDGHSGKITIGIGVPGPRLLNFAPILVFEEIPLNHLIKKLLSLCEKTLNAPVEIEFAMTFSKDKKLDISYQFGFLQVRSMVVPKESIQIDPKELTYDSVLLGSVNVLGNGMVDTIQDIVYVKPEKFDAKYSKQIAAELEIFNKNLLSENRPYLLVGFGRWGSSDPWLGIPVIWGQVSGAKIIVEAMLENMNVDLSQGSHFFHNLTSLGVCYFSVPYSRNYKIDWKWLNDQKIVDETQYIRRITLIQPIYAKVDGRNSCGVIHKMKI